MNENPYERYEREARFDSCIFKSCFWFAMLTLAVGLRFSAERFRTRPYTQQPQPASQAQPNLTSETEAVTSAH